MISLTQECRQAILDRGLFDKDGRVRPVSKFSSRYNNLRYAILTLCDVIESCEIKKVVYERYLPQLDRLTEEMKEVKKGLAKEMEDKDAQRIYWASKVGSYRVDAICDKSLDEDLKERIVEGLRELSERILNHNDESS